MWTPQDLPHLVAKTVRDHTDLATRWRTDPKFIAATANPEHSAQVIERAIMSLEDAPLTWLDSGVCEMLADTYRDVPAFSPQACMPGDSGTIALESPFFTVAFTSHMHDQTVLADCDALHWRRIGDMVRISALSRFDGKQHHLSPFRRACPLHEALAVMIDFDVVRETDAEVEYRISGEVKSVGRAQASGNAIVSAMASVWLLLSQPRVMREDSPVVASVRRRKATSGVSKKRPVRVSVRTLETSPRSGARGGGRKATSRWWVRGHWRQQAWGKNRALRKPVFIAPHTAGSSDGDLDERPQVQVWRDNRKEEK